MSDLSWTLVVLLAIYDPGQAIPACSQNEDVCRFTLIIEAKLTMMWGKVLTYPYNGSLFQYDVIDPDQGTPVPTEEVIQTDGWESPRLVLVFNSSLPGPAIEVYEHQTVMVHVTNHLHNDGVTIHWHGVHQTGTPYMDGVAFVSQCPILPGQTFTYMFEASPKGTLWYHSHMGSQRTMGLYGPLIIHERYPIEIVEEEFIWTISDWNHEYDSEVGFYKMVYGIYEGRTKYQGTRSLDGSFFSWFQYHSGLLNGKGRFYDPLIEQHNDAPLTSFTVLQGRRYRVRLINAGGLFPFRISVDAHLITIIASDGYDIEPVTAESLIINPGERFDFIIEANQPIGNYWIRGVTLEAGYNHTLEGILHYEGAPVNVDPSTERQACAPGNKCVVVNCPFGVFPKQNNTACISFDDLKSKEKADTPQVQSGKFHEQFLNFAFPGYRWTPGSINGKAFEQPNVAAISGQNEADTSCSKADCGEEKVCKCTWALHLQHGHTYQFVFLNMGKGKGWSHPIHMHGHSFYVLKMGYGRYDPATGRLVGDNLDVDCRGNPDRRRSFCNNATWSNPAWKDGNFPELELERPPRKDTLIVPTGGYAVVRIRADNPGLWMMHCHIQTHNLDGMAMLLNESFLEMPDMHKELPSCKNYVHLSADVDHDFDEYPNDGVPDETVQTVTGVPCAGYSFGVFWAVVGSLICLSVIFLAILVVYMYLDQKERITPYSHEDKGAGYTLEKAGLQLTHLTAAHLNGHGGSRRIQNGLNGHNSVNGRTAPNGLSRQNGLRGHSELNGHNGVNDHNGVNGHNGHNGVNGHNGHNGLNGHSGLNSQGNLDDSKTIVPYIQTLTNEQTGQLYANGTAYI